MNKLEKYTMIGAALFGIATIALGLIMLFIFPSTAQLTDGFRTPIIAFEFAKTDADLAFLTGSDELARTNRQMMDNGHRWDTAFPFAYAGFIALLLLGLAARGHRWLWLGIPVALLIIPLDLRENGVLVAITQALRSGNSATALLQELHTATWLKWGALGISLAVLASGLLADRAFLAAAVSMVVALGIAACWASGSAPRVAEAMSLLTALFFLYFPVRAVIEASRIHKGARPECSPP